MMIIMMIIMTIGKNIAKYLRNLPLLKFTHFLTPRSQTIFRRWPKGENRASDQRVKRQILRCQRKSVPLSIWSRGFSLHGEWGDTFLGYRKFCPGAITMMVYVTIETMWLPCVAHACLMIINHLLTCGSHVWHTALITLWDIGSERVKTISNNPLKPNLTTCIMYVFITLISEWLPIQNTHTFVKERWCHPQAWDTFLSDRLDFGGSMAWEWPPLEANESLDSNRLSIYPCPDLEKYRHRQKWADRQTDCIKERMYA